MYQFFAKLSSIQEIINFDINLYPLISQVIIYSGQSLMSRRPPLKWLVYTVMEVFEESNYYSFSWASKVAQLNFLLINRPNTLYYSSESHCCTNMYDQVTGSSGRQLLQK